MATTKSPSNESQAQMRKGKNLSPAERAGKGRKSGMPVGPSMMMAPMKATMPVVKKYKPTKAPARVAGRITVKKAR